MSVFSQARIDVFFNKADALKGIKELKDTVRSSANDMKSSFMGSLGKLGAAYLGGKMFKSAYDNMNNIVNMAHKWGRGTEGISILANEMTMLGGSTEDALNTVDTLEQAITDLRTTGSGPLKAVASQIGAQIYNADGSLKTYSQLLSEIRQKLRLVKDDATRTKVLQELGLTSPTQISYMTMSEEKLKRINKEASKQGVITKKAEKTMEKFNEAVGKLKASFQSLVGELMGDFAPVIDIFSKIVDYISSLPSSVRKLVLALSALKLTGGFGLITKTFSGLSSIFTSLGGNLGTIVTQIGGMVALVAQLWGWYEKFKEMFENGGQETINKDKGNFEKNVTEGNWWEIAKHPIDTVTALSGKAVDWMTNWGEEGNLSEYAAKARRARASGNTADAEKYQKLYDAGLAELRAKREAENKTVNIENINIRSTDPKESAMELQNVLNRGMAGGVI